MEEALFLTRYASRVFIVHRRDAFRASKIMADRVLHHHKITVLWDSVAEEVIGDTVVRSIRIQNVKSKKSEIHPAAGVFFAIGHSPNTAFLKGSVDLNEQGYIKLVPGTNRTSIHGIFAAGDVHDHVYRQAITASGSGCMASLEVEREISAMSSR
jgi:thioredoxin reductase (NADPH)